jgi:glycosyltransferase involved in cell wall biosynthesis
MGLQDVVKEAGYLPMDEFHRLMKTSDLLMAINYDGFATLIPGKIYEYWAVAGPPILLLSCPGAAQNLIEQYELGFASDPKDVKAIADVLLDVMRKRAAGEPMRISKAGIENFDRRNLSKRLAALLDSMVAK